MKLHEHAQIDYSYQEELNEACKEYNYWWKELDNFYKSKRQFIYLNGQGKKFGGDHQQYAGINGIYKFDWRKHPRKFKFFKEKLEPLARRCSDIRKKMGFTDVSMQKKKNFKNKYFDL